MPAKPTKPNSTAQAPSAYKAAIDAHAEACHRTATAFAPYAQDTPNMTVALAAGQLLEGTTLTEVAAQSTGTITAPVTHPRIDRVVIDRATGVASVVAGTEAASPTAPAIPAGTLPVARVALTVGQTAIVNANITDERVGGGAGVTIGSIADPSETEVPSTQDVADALAAIPTADSIARQIEMMTAMIVWRGANKASGPIPSGYLFTFQSDELATKTNATYDAVNKTYNSQGTSSLISQGVGTLIPGTFDVNTSALNDGVESQASTPAARVSTNGSISSVRSGRQWSTTKKVCGFRVVGASDTGLVYSAPTEIYTISLRHSSDGINWTVDYTTTGITDAAGKINDYPIIVTPSSAYLYHDVLVQASGNGSFACAEIAFYEYSSPQNMTLRSVAVTVASAPARAELSIVHQAVDSVTLNTDLKVRVSRDGGATWSAYGTLSKVCDYDASFALLKATCDLTTAASGTSVIWEVTTYNNKTQKVEAVGLILS